MICKKCNAEIPNDSMFCPECGEPAEKETLIVEETVETVETNEQEPTKSLAEPEIEVSDDEKDGKGSKVKLPKEKKSGNLYNILGIIVGIICIVYGLTTFMDTYTGLSPASFGADFYTYTYDGIYAAANLLASLTKVCSLILVGLGSFMVCFFGGKMKK